MAISPDAPAVAEDSEGGTVGLVVSDRGRESFAALPGIMEDECEDIGGGGGGGGGEVELFC